MSEEKEVRQHSLLGCLGFTSQGEEQQEEFLSGQPKGGAEAEKENGED